MHGKFLSEPLGMEPLKLSFEEDNIFLVDKIFRRIFLIPLGDPFKSLN